MNITDLIAVLVKFHADMGDLPVVLEGALSGDGVDVYWDEDENDNTVLVIGA
jgi:hypothetical protein